jgi:hypothetical protein
VFELDRRGYPAVSRSTVCRVLRVSSRGAIMIGGQRIHAGLPHGGKTAEITIDPDTYQIPSRTKSP